MGHGPKYNKSANLRVRRSVNNVQELKNIATIKSVYQNPANFSNIATKESSLFTSKIPKLFARCRLRFDNFASSGVARGVRKVHVPSGAKLRVRDFWAPAVWATYWLHRNIDSGSGIIERNHSIN